MDALYQKFSTAKFDENGQLTDFKLNYESNFNYGYDVVDKIAEEEPQKRAVVWCDEAGNERTLTFGEIRNYSNQVANYLSAQGIQKGDRVLLMLRRHYSYWYMMPALHKLGAVAIPATHMLREKDIIYRVDAAQVRAIVCAADDTLCERVRNAAAKTENRPALYNVCREIEGFVQIDAASAACPETLERRETHMDEPFLMYFTSGTTGNPKMVVHSHTYPLAHIVTAKYWQKVKNDGLHLTVADTGWAKASWGKLYGQWLAGGAIMVYDYDRFDAEHMMYVLKHYGVTSFCAPPTVYRLLAKSGLSLDCFETVEHISTAGEALQEEIIRLFQEQTGKQIMEGYGQTETTLLIGNFVPGKRGSMGKINPHYEIYLENDEGERVPAGTPGEIVIDTRERMPEGLCRSYEKNEQANARYWRNGVFHTGDIAICDEDGYYYFVSRKDDVIKSSGYRIGPFEVESVLVQHPAVVECAVTGVPDEERGQLVKATIVLRSGYESSDALKTELQKFVKERTAPYKYPKIVEFVEELPKTISGKIRYNVLRKEAEES